MTEEETIKTLNDYLCKTHTKFCSVGAVGIPNKEYYAIETLLDLYKQNKQELLQEKEKNIKLLNSKIGIDLSYDDYISKDKIKAIRDKAEVMDYYTLNNVIDDLTNLIGDENNG